MNCDIAHFEVWIYYVSGVHVKLSYYSLMKTMKLNNIMYVSAAAAGWIITIPRSSACMPACHVPKHVRSVYIFTSSYRLVHNVYIFGGQKKLYVQN